MLLEPWIRRLVPLLGVLGIFLPALTASIPLLPRHQWSAAEISVGAVRSGFSSQNQKDGGQPSLSTLLRQARDMRRDLSQATGHGGQIPASFKLALLIPVAVVLAAICTLLVLVESWLDWSLAVTVTSAIGILCGGYTIIASWLLTHTLRAEVRQVMERTQKTLSFLHLNTSSFSQTVGLATGVGVYLMLVTFVILLVLPAGMLPPAPEAS